MVSDPFNEGDVFNAYKGRVKYNFEISKYELTNAEYARFLSSCCRYADPYHLYNRNMSTGAVGGIIKDSLDTGEYVYYPKQGWERKPVTYVSYYDLCRYANWLHFGCPDNGVSELGTTEGTKKMGAYDTRFFSDVINGIRKPYKKMIKRNRSAKYFIPNDNEWYKAAYYDPTIDCQYKYHLYPTGSEYPNSSNANFMINDSLCVGPPFFVCDVNMYEESKTYYGTVNQGGNVWEWIEDWQWGQVGSLSLRGGSFSYTEFGLSSVNIDAGGLNDISYVFGGRLARASAVQESNAITIGWGTAFLRGIYYFSMANTKTLLLIIIILIMINAILLSGKKFLIKIFLFLKYPVDILIWLIRRIHFTYKPISNRVMIFPCDPWSVFGSRGDEAMIEVAIERTKKENTEFYFVVATEEAYTAVVEKGFKAVMSWSGKFPIYNILKSIKNIKPYKVVILGADCMDGYYGTGISFNLMAVADLCAVNGIDYNLLGFSFNQNPKRGLFLPYRLSSNKLRYKLRDEVSLNRFEQFTGKKGELVADAAFLLRPSMNFIDFEAIKNKINGLKSANDMIIGFNYHPMLLQNQSYDTVVANANKIGENISSLLQRDNNLKFVFIPHDDRSRISDNVVLPIIYKKVSENGYADRVVCIEKVYHAAEIKAIVSLCDLVVCSRMHLAIATLSQGIPAIGVKYQGKFDGLFNHFGYPEKFLITQDDLVSESFCDLIEDLISSMIEIKSMLVSKSDYIKSLAIRNFEN